MKLQRRSVNQLIRMVQRRRSDVRIDNKENTIKPIYTMNPNPLAPSSTIGLRIIDAIQYEMLMEYIQKASFPGQNFATINIFKMLEELPFMPYTVEEIRQRIAEQRSLASEEKSDSPAIEPEQKQVNSGQRR